MKALILNLYNFGFETEFRSYLIGVFSTNRALERAKNLCLKRLPSEAWKDSIGNEMEIDSWEEIKLPNTFENGVLGIASFSSVGLNSEANEDIIFGVFVNKTQAEEDFQKFQKSEECQKELAYRDYGQVQLKIIELTLNNIENRLLSEETR